MCGGLDNNSMNEQQLTFILNECKCTMRDVLSSSRKANIVEARQLIAYTMRRNGSKYHEIARTIGRNHPNCIYAVNRICGLLSVGDKITKIIVERIKEIENEKE